MTDNTPPDPAALFDRIVNGDPTRKAVEQAIQKGLQSFIETATQEITKLVESNTLGPDVKEEMLQLQKAIISMTIDAVKNGPLGYLKNAGK